jgi:hypothetical protein
MNIMRIGNITGEPDDRTMIHYHGGNKSCDGGGYFSYSFDIDISGVNDNLFGKFVKLHLIEEFIDAENIPLILNKFFYNGWSCPRLCTIWIGKGHPKELFTHKFKKQIDICGA